MKKIAIAILVLAMLAAVIPLGVGVSTVSADAGTKWAILVSGGLNPQENDAAFWNDIGETYDILVNRYGYDPANVFVLYANGNPPTTANCHSYYYYEGYYFSYWIHPYPYPTNIIDYSATSANLQTVCQYIAAHDGPQDNLYVYMTDHGTGSYNYCLWGETITSSTFGSYINLIDDISWRAFALDFCHSRGFINAIPDPLPTVYFCSCQANEVCFTGDDGYGVFTYYFNAALKGCIPQYVSPAWGSNGTVDADSNNDGKVTLQEAFSYAYYRTVSGQTHPVALVAGSIGDDLLVLGQAYNTPPVARSGGPGYYSGDAGASITFDGSTSYDSDGVITYYLWDFGDGSTAPGATVDHTYSSEGFYTATITVLDDDGFTDNDTVGVRVGSEVVTCDAAGNPTQWFGPGETVYVKGTWFEPDTPYWMWIQDDLVLDGDALVSSEDPSGSQEKVTTAAADGSFGPVRIWTIPIDLINYRVYDVIVDAYPARYGTRYDGFASFSVIAEAPAAVDDGYSVNEDTLLTVPAPGVLGNDYDLAGRPLTAALVSGPSHGALTFNADGSFAYMPEANFSSADSFTYTANYEETASNVATVTITVRSVNDAPVAMGDEYTMYEGAVLTVEAPGVLANDTDVEGNPMRSILVSNPDRGELILGSDGYFVYTPKSDFSGVDSFTYKVREPKGLESNVATVYINVIPVNDAPVAGSDSYSIEAGSTLVVAAPGVLANDTDADEGDVLRVGFLEEPAYGELALNKEDGSFSYTPKRGFSGVDSFLYAAFDGQAYSRKTPVTITVTAAGSGPTVANPIPDRTATEDSAFSYTFPENTFSVANPGDTLTYAATLVGGDPLPEWLTFNASTRTFAGTPGNADVGVITVIVTATDQNEAAAADSFDITVINVNDAPTPANAIPDQTATEDVAFAYAFPKNTFNDVDMGDSLTYTATLPGDGPLPEWLEFDGAARRFEGTPANEDVGVITVIVTATDQIGAWASDSFDITVINVNDAPTEANPIPLLKIPEGESFTYTLPSDTFVDVDAGDTLTYSATLVGSEGLPDWLQFDADTATFSGTPGFDSADQYKLAITATDQSGASVLTALRLTVVNVNRPPQLLDIPGPQTDFEGDSVCLQIQASDPDGDPILFTVTGLPTDLTCDNTTGVISGTWGAGSAGYHIVVVTVWDSASHTFVVIPWTVNEVTPPPVPVLLYPANGKIIKDNTPWLDWSDVADPSGVVYELQVDNDADFSSPVFSKTGITSSSRTLTTLADGLYYWRARAVDGVGNMSAWTAAWAFTVDTTTPAVPVLVYPANGKVTRDNTPWLDWSDVTDATGVKYQLQVDNNADFSSPVFSKTGMTASSRTLSALPDGTYYWKVRAVDGAGNASAWTTLWSFTIDTTTPSVPVLLYPADGRVTSDTTPWLDWSDVTDATGVKYQLQVDNNADFSSPVVNKSGLTVSSRTLSTLPDGTYYWRVRATDAAGNASAWTSARSFTIV